MAEKEAAKTAAKKPVQKGREVIKEYERMYGAKLTEQELDSVIERSFTSPSISGETRKTVKKKLAEKKTEKK